MTTVVNNSSAETGEACDRVLSLIADLQGEHEVMAGPFDPTKWKIDVSVADLQALVQAALAMNGGPQAAPVLDLDADLKEHRFYRDAMIEECAKIADLSGDNAATEKGREMATGIAATICALALTRPSQGGEPQTLTVTPEMVEAVRKAKCFACGAFPYEDCQRHPQRDCGREFNGGSRKAKKA